ncbi:hypothetical protein [Chengkuizengella axinellae]|uniref:Uncharacterized protein n=1 Tax=Chengkuizengella axinellae TaxID=3064388 RepID=A0ABT9IV22_9BACL|nr:hypothetical protein [Chengkuizengella sp. 2205SS18-9]MDP5273206.1 hypothetical protein [Chengkuizengella sp. 2205SS18-9]
MIYPVALTKEQQNIMPWVGMMLGELKYVQDQPQGSANNLLLEKLKR